MSKYFCPLVMTIFLSLVVGCSSPEPPAVPLPTATAASGGLAVVATATAESNIVVEEPTALPPTATPASEPAVEPTPTETAQLVATAQYQNPLDISQKKCKRLDSLTYHPFRQTILGLNNEGLICEIDPLSGEVLGRHSISEDDPEALTADQQTGMLFVAATEDGDIWEVDPESYQILHKYEVKFTLNEVKIADKKDIETKAIALTTDPSGSTLLYLLIEIDDPAGDYQALVESTLPTEKLAEKMDLTLNSFVRFDTKDFRGLLHHAATNNFYTLNKETLMLIELSAAGEQLQAWPVKMDKPDAFIQLADGTLYVAQKEGLFKYAAAAEQADTTAEANTGIEAPSTETTATQTEAQPETTAADSQPETVTTPEEFSFQLEADFALNDCNNLSGVVYHLERNTLFVINDNGTLCELEPASDTVLRKEKITGDDLEGITYNPATGLLYIAVERKEAVIEVDPNTFAILRTFEIERTFNGQTVLAKGGQGLESITFVPDATNPEGGTFFVSNQSFDTNKPEDASAVVEVVLPLNQPVTAGNVTVPILHYYPLEVLDLSGMYYSAAADLLYIVSDDSDTLLEVTRTGEIVASYPLPGDGQEGITLDPNGALYIAEDLAGLTFYRPLTQ